MTSTVEEINKVYSEELTPINSNQKIKSIIDTLISEIYAALNKVGGKIKVEGDEGLKLAFSLNRSEIHKVLDSPMDVEVIKTKEKSFKEETNRIVIIGDKTDRTNPVLTSIYTTEGDNEGHLIIHSHVENGYSQIQFDDHVNIRKIVSALEELRDLVKRVIKINEASPAFCLKYPLIASIIREYFKSHLGSKVISEVINQATDITTIIDQLNDELKKSTKKVISYTAYKLIQKTKKTSFDLQEISGIKYELKATQEELEELLDYIFKPLEEVVGGLKVDPLKDYNLHNIIYILRLIAKSKKALFTEGQMQILTYFTENYRENQINTSNYPHVRIPRQMIETLSHIKNEHSEQFLIELSQKKPGMLTINTIKALGQLNTQKGNEALSTLVKKYHPSRGDMFEHDRGRHTGIKEVGLMALNELCTNIELSPEQLEEAFWNLLNDKYGAEAVFIQLKNHPKPEYAERVQTYISENLGRKNVYGAAEALLSITYEANKETSYSGTLPHLFLANALYLVGSLPNETVVKLLKNLTEYSINQSTIERLLSGNLYEEENLTWGGIELKEGLKEAPLAQEILRLLYNQISKQNREAAELAHKQEAEDTLFT